jgi:YidC/Oxa1 family membrane protein insertase
VSSIFNKFLVEPIYNALVALFHLTPVAEAGLAIIFITVLVRLALFPLSRKAVVAQIEMQRLAPELESIKNKYKDNQEEQARKTLALYKERGVNPFSGILVLLIQLPVIFALYHIFVATGFPEINQALLYSFVKAPETVTTIFLGVDLTEKSLVLALLAAVSTFYQIKLASPKEVKGKQNPSFGDDLARSMQKQMKYFFPVMVFFIAYSISGVIALYWLTTNIFTVAQEIFVRNKLSQQA